MSDTVLELEQVVVRHDPRLPPQLDRVSLTVAPGECVAIVGPNGAGKTTALRALLGLARLAGGEARIEGRPVAAWPRDALARAVAVVAQREEPAFPVMVSEVVAMGRYPYLGPWRAPAAADHAAVARAMERADVARLRDRWVESLSGGEWQRVRLARALAQEPRGLVLDEPSAALDVRHEMELFELVAELVARERLAALVVSHHLNVAARFADRLVLLAGGQAVATGRPVDVLTADRLSAVFGWPITVVPLPDGSPHLYPQRRAQPGAGESP